MKEIKLKYYNSKLGIGFNDWRIVYDVNKEQWLKCCYHKGRLVYGKERIPYTSIKRGIDKFDFIIQEFCPF